MKVRELVALLTDKTINQDDTVVVSADGFERGKIDVRVRADVTGASTHVSIVAEPDWVP